MRQHVFFCLLWIGLLVYLVYKVTLSALPYNPLSPGINQKTTITSIIPEGWGFFTRNPRETDLYLFFSENGKWVKNRNTPISSWRNSFGLNRFPRAQSVELGMILNSINDTCWKTAMINIDNNTITDTVVIQITDRSPSPTITGRICIVQQEPIPWAWSWNREKLKMPSQYVIVDIKNE